MTQQQQKTPSAFPSGDAREEVRVPAGRCCTSAMRAPSSKGSDLLQPVNVHLFFIYLFICCIRFGRRKFGWSVGSTLFRQRPAAAARRPPTKRHRHDRVDLLQKKRRHSSHQAKNDCEVQDPVAKRRPSSVAGRQDNHKHKRILVRYHTNTQLAHPSPTTTTLITSSSL